MIHVVLSAFFFTITFFITKLSIVTMMVFLIPLHSMKNKNKRDGFVWGLMVFGIYWLWLIPLFKNQSLVYIGILFWILATLWCAMYSMIWFSFFKNYPTISTTIFFLFVTQLILIPLAALEGIPFISPLVLLAEYRSLLTPLFYISDVGMFLLLFGIQNWIALQNIKIQLLYGTVLSSLIFISPLVFVDTKKRLTGVKTITPWWYNKKGGVMFDGYRLAHDLCDASQQKNIQFIITPESTFCFDVNEYQNFISIWCDSANDRPVLLGTHVKKKGFPHNAMLLLHNNEIKRCYFKQHKMPFLEKSLWFEYFLSKPILSCALIPEVKSDSMQNDLLCINGKIYQLYMCSEFFMQTKKVWGYPIVLLWNDGWLSCDYMKQLAGFFITYFEMKYKVDVYHAATSGITNIG